MSDLDTFKAKYGPGSEINKLNRSIRNTREALKDPKISDAQKIILQEQLKEDQKRLFRLMRED